MHASLRHRLGILPGLLLALALGLALIGSVQAEPSHLSDPPPDQVVVKLKSGVSINTILARYNATLLGTLTETNLYFLQLPAGQTAGQILPVLSADQDLHYAEPNYYSENAPGGGFIMFGAHMSPLAEFIMFGAHGEGTPTAPPPGSTQWAWSRINLTDAQKISRGQGIIVAVLDTGLAPDHPLLSSSLTAGYDFVGMTSDIYDSGNGLDDGGNGLVDEFVGHGTHVSGILVTEAPGIQIMPIRVLNSDGVGTYWEVAAGIKYAVDHGARIINMSLSAPRLTPSLQEALEYAAAHGVIVVAAAGTGPGPNYPAAYADPLTVLGVGASDPNDASAWFSGGRTADTDVYAPGTSIYSAFPYNGYGPGSGTSMSAPIVAGEAALLLSRYPDWTPAQVAQRIVSRTDPVPGRTAGRVNLRSALTTGLEAWYSVGDFGLPNDNHMKPRIRIANHTAEDIPFTELTIRYWYTSDTGAAQMFNCDFASLSGCSSLTGAIVLLAEGHPNRTVQSDTYFEVGFTPGGGTLPAGGLTDLYLRLNRSDWSNYSEGNDYSYDSARNTPARWDRITIYRNGSLVWGVEPAGGTGATATLTAPAATQTHTQVPASPTRTLTPTRTATLVPATITAKKSATPAAPSPTATRTPTAASSGGSVKIQYYPAAGAANSQAISPHMILVNTGTTTIPLSELKVRYWFTREGTAGLNYWCDYAAINCTNISAQFTALQTARPGADSYLEISFSSGAGNLAPGVNSGQIQSRFSKSDWSPFVQTGDHSFDSGRSQFADWDRITVYRNGVLIWGIEP